MIQTTALEQKFGQRTLWKDLDLTFEEGTISAITGTSGSGKSTLLNCLGALGEPTSGTITVDSREITSLSRRGRRLYRRHTVGYLFQDYALVPDRSVLYNLRIAITRSERSKISAALDRVGLSDYEDRVVHELSGGEQQRVALARVILRGSSVVLADEPTGALDASNAKMVTDTLRKFAEEGSTVVVATHSRAVVDTADQVVNLDERWSKAGS